MSTCDGWAALAEQVALLYRALQRTPDRLRRGEVGAIRGILIMLITVALLIVAVGPRG